MQTDLLFDQFDTLLTTPDDVAHLEAAILQLAVRGKVVRQDPDDEPATELLKRIRAEKEQLVHEGEIRKTKRLPLIKDAEIPYELPASWMWVRLPEIYRNWGQKKPDEDFTYIDVSAIDKERGVIGDDLQVITLEDAPSRARKIVKRGTVIYSTVRPYLLNIAIVDKDFTPPPIVSTAFAVMYPLGGVANKYLYYYLRSQPFIDFVESQMTGMAYPAISDSKLRLGLFPLPPLAEQKRIVAKVDDLLAQTRALAAQLEQADAALVPTAQAAFHSLLDAQDTTTQHEAWQRIADHFETLTSDPRTIAALKQTVLQLAVQGKLVPQDPNDEPASVLIERTTAEKEWLIQEGKTRKAKPLPSIKADEVPYALPASWVWVRLGEVTNYGSSDKANGNDLSDNIWVLDLQDIEKGTSRLLEKVRFSERPFKSAKNVFCEGDVLYGKLRPYLDKVLVADEDGVCSSEIIPIRGYMGIDPYYLRFALKRPDFIAYVNSKTYGVKMPRLGTTDARMALIPLPPLAEQKRIVAKIEALLALCDALAAEVAAAEEVRARLLQAILNGG
ncbi:MAG: restriction endonuclease subunit S [Anaerolineales bacterium]|nr:restriction endonuclease subunit S [Anaerolineales bacterium]